MYMGVLVRSRHDYARRHQTAVHASNIHPTAVESFFAVARQNQEVIFEVEDYTACGLCEERSGTQFSKKFYRVRKKDRDNGDGQLIGNLQYRWQSTLSKTCIVALVVESEIGAGSTDEILFFSTGA